MSIFKNIMSRIWGRSAEAAPAPGASEAGNAGGQMAAPASTAAPMPPPMAAPTSTGMSTGTSGTAPAQPAAAPVDVEAVLTALAAQNPQRLNWRQSIVDLMKLLDLDSSLAARKDLAEELGYTGTRDGSAEMNIWLHRAVMRRLAENGGRVPDDLRH